MTQEQYEERRRALVAECENTRQPDAKAAIQQKMRQLDKEAEAAGLTTYG